MSNERPLMKCPHCGKLNWSCVEYSATGAFQIQCTTCRAAGPIGDSRDNAMELWNWRALDEARQGMETEAPHVTNEHGDCVPHCLACKRIVKEMNR